MITTHDFFEVVRKARVALGLPAEPDENELRKVASAPALRLEDALAKAVAAIAASGALTAAELARFEASTAGAEAQFEILKAGVERADAGRVQSVNN